MAIQIGELLIPGAIGLLAYEALTHEQRDALHDAVAPKFGAAVSTAPSTVSGIAGKSVGPVNVAPGATYNQASPLAHLPFLTNAGPNVGSSQTTTTQAQAIQDAEAKAKAKYDQLSAAAKAKGAAALSKALKIKPALTGKESYKDMAKAAGAAAGAAACTATGVGVTLTPLCAIVGAYFGEHLEEWIADHYAQIASTVKTDLKKVENKVRDLVGNAYDEVSSWL
jgi:hypothetical protein